MRHEGRHRVHGHRPRLHLDPQLFRLRSKLLLGSASPGDGGHRRGRITAERMKEVPPLRPECASGPARLLRAQGHNAGSYLLMLQLRSGQAAAAGLSERCWIKYVGSGFTARSEFH